MDFLKSKFDNISLFCVLLLLGFMILHIVHHQGDATLVSWIEQTFTTALGAYIGLTQASRISWQNKSNGNGGTNAPSKTDSPVVAGTVLPTYPKS